jgi:predicted AAA+ superfamily ATPase
VLKGPRQVGKTTIQEQLIQDLLKAGVPGSHIFRIQFDDLPTLRGVDERILALARWYQKHILGMSFNEAAHAGTPAYLFLDEVQNLSDWATQVKSLVDTSTVRVLVTGSSALRIEAGRDSLAGRVSTVEMGPFLVREIAELMFDTTIAPRLANGFDAIVDADFWRDASQHSVEEEPLRDHAFELFSERGGYPVAYANKATIPWPQVADQLNENVVRRVIRHDLRMGERGRRRDENLLEEVFRLACRYCGQSPGQALYVQELQRALSANIGWQRVLSYLRFLEGSLLVSLVEPLELRLRRRKGNLKLCLSDHGLRASWLQEVIPLSPSRLDGAPHLSDIAGHLAESVAGYFLSSIPGIDIAHLPERGVDPEVDFVLTVGERRIPVEVKYRRRIDDGRDTLGLRAFLEKTVYNAPFGLLVTLTDDVKPTDPRIVPISLRSLLFMR